jgi:hypothetical protein
VPLAFSDGVGDGEMTRGVDGTWYCCDMVEKMLRGGNGLTCITPPTCCIAVEVEYKVDLEKSRKEIVAVVQERPVSQCS